MKSKKQWEELPEEAQFQQEESQAKKQAQQTRVTSKNKIHKYTLNC